MVGWRRVMAFSRIDTAGRSSRFKSGSGSVDTPDHIWGHRTAERGYNRPTMQASPCPGDFRGCLASNNEHFEAGTCPSGKQLEAGATWTTPYQAGSNQVTTSGTAR